MALIVITYAEPCQQQMARILFDWKKPHTPIFPKKRGIANIWTDVQESKRTNQKIRSINPLQVVKKTECELESNPKHPPSTAFQNFGGY